MRRLYLLLMLVVPAVAGPLSFGVKGGVPISDTFEYSSNPNRPNLTSGDYSSYSSYSAKDNPYTVGPSIELKLPRGFGIEFDALYRHASYHSSFVGFGGSSYGIVAEEQKVRVNTWTFPVMAKYRLPLRGFQPYVAGGMAFRRIQADVNSLAGNKGLFETQFSFHSFSYDAPSELKHRSPLGGVIGVGLDFGFRHLRFSPEIRYTGWSSRSFESGASQFFVRSKQSETTVLFGVMF